MRKTRFALAAVSAILFAGLIVAWLVRFRVAEAFVSRRLAAAGVSASYRLTRLGPFHERIQDVRIGNPASPDLLADRVDITLGYGSGGAFIRSVHGEGVRLQGRLDHDGLSLGALDRLLPRSGGGAGLPDIEIGLRRAHVILATPNGTLTALADGDGNPQRSFRGKARITASSLRLAACEVRDVQAMIGLGADHGVPRAVGPVVIGSTVCPQVRLGEGSARLDLAADAALRRLTGSALLEGFAGRAGAARFAKVAAQARASGEFGALDLAARLELTALSLSRAARKVRALQIGLAGTPFGPTVGRAQQAVADSLATSDAALLLAARLRGREITATVHEARLMAKDGGHILVTGQGDGITWNGRELRLAAAIAGGGGALPPFRARVHQTSSSGFAGVARIGPYHVGAASLDVPALRFEWAAGQATFGALVRADGAFGGGNLQGLAIPIRGRAGADGAFAIGEGCETVAFRALRLGIVSLAANRIPVCGQPILSRPANGRVRLDATLGAFALRGRTTSGTPVAIAAGSAHVSARDFTANTLDVTLGDAAAPTRLEIGTVQGALASSAVTGSFASVAARIGSVPLRLSEAAGTWQVEHGDLTLTGALRVDDAASPARFHTLAATGAALTLTDGRIHATAMLREPTTDVPVSSVAIDHDLADGTGHAALNVNGLRFIPKGLQPEMLTPLTLGVIANVAGTLDGQGRIDWDGKGVRSEGSFQTGGLDLAAAFGPVAGITGRIVFTDLLNLVSAPDQVATIKEVNPGVAITDGTVRYSLTGQNRVTVNSARWPFAGGTLRLDPTTLAFGVDAERHLTFHLDGLDAAAFVQQLDFPNLSATGTFDGALPMVFGPAGGRIVGGIITARPPGGTLAYVGELSSARLGTMGKLAFDALKAIRYSSLSIGLDGQLDGEMISRVDFTGVREATGDRGLIARMIRNLPFRFNINIRAPFRGLVGTARSYMEPQLLLQDYSVAHAAIIQPPASGDVR